MIVNFTTSLYGVCSPGLNTISFYFRSTIKRRSIHLANEKGRAISSAFKADIGVELNARCYLFQ